MHSEGIIYIYNLISDKWYSFTRFKSRDIFIDMTLRHQRILKSYSDIFEGTYSFMNTISHTFKMSSSKTFYGQSTCQEAFIKHL